MFERAQEILCIDLIETAGQLVAAGSEVERCADRRCTIKQTGGGGFAFAEPLEQGIAAHGNADRVKRPFGMPLLQPVQNPVDLLTVSRMVGARQPVRFAGTAPEMDHHTAPADCVQPVHQGARIVAARTAFEPMKQGDQRNHGGSGGRRVCITLYRTAGTVPVEVDEVAVRSLPSLPVVERQGRFDQQRVEGLEVAAGEPLRCGVLDQCSVRTPPSGGSLLLSVESRVVESAAAEAWRESRRQPLAPR